MLFPTAAFAVFFVVALAGAWALAGHPTLRKCWLVAAGGYFYSYWDTKFVALLAAMAIGNWAFAHAVHRCASSRARAAVTAAGIAADVAVLAVFKYYGFFVDAVSGGLARFGLHVHPPLLELALPVGISFYCFQVISYLVDVHRRQTEPAALLDVATWLAFFPTVTSGPITRAGELIPQIRATPDPAGVDTSRALWLLARGIAKKLVVASFLATAITDKAFTDPASYNSVVLLIAVYAYAVQIYVDFSGYTDMAIGLAALLGFTLPENFNRPYTATSVQDFWSRWHMTLSRWLRDYLFAPLTGRRADRPARTFAGIVVVMLIAGLWHGAAWGFVVFGGVHGVAMAFERWSRERRRRLHRPAPQRSPRRQLVRRVVTFHIVCLGWAFFASGTVGQALDLLRGVATNWTRPVTSLTPLLLITIAGVIAAQYLPASLGRRLARWARGLRPAAQAAAFGAALLPLLAMAPTTVPAFIYYRF